MIAHQNRVKIAFGGSGCEPRIVVIEDENGRRYRTADRAQELFDNLGMSANTLAAGENCRRKVVFDLPKNLTHPKLRIAFGGRIGEVLDWFLYGDRWFELPAKAIPAKNDDLT